MSNYNKSFLTLALGIGIIIISVAIAGAIIELII